MRIVRRLSLAASIFLLAAIASAESLQGTTGHSEGDQWASSWLDLSSPTDFKKGEILTIKLEGNAENVVVRLLLSTSPPDAQDGLEGYVRKVPVTKVLIVKLESNHSQVKQISVHSGHAAWQISLGGNNGNATIVSIDRSTR
jgi:hypothetical protein